MGIGAQRQPQRDAGFLQPNLKCGHRLANGRTIVVVHPRIDMRGAGGHGNAIPGGDSGHGQRGGEIGGAVVDAGQEMAMEIDHGF